MGRARTTRHRAPLAGVVALGPVVAGLLASASPAAAAPRPSGPHRAVVRQVGARLSARGSSLLGRINAVRRAHHLSTVRLDPRLTSSAQAWSETMARGQNLWHDLARLHRLDDQTREACLREALARVPTGMPGTAAITTQGWLGSASHRAEILAPGMHRAGIGIVARDGQYYITLDIGS